MIAGLATAAAAVTLGCLCGILRLYCKRSKRSMAATGESQAMDDDSDLVVGRPVGPAASADVAPGVPVETLEKVPPAKEIP